MNELYELPDGWEWKEIDNVVVKTKNKSPKNDSEREFTYIDISSINNSTFTIDTPKILIGSEAPSRAKKEVFKNDIVFATTRPNLKNIAIVKEEYNNPIASTGFCILRANETIQYQYLFFYVLSNVFYKQVEKNIRGAQYPAVSDTDVRSINIPLPPLQEQKRIVSKLDRLFEKIDKAIALHQKNMDEADVFMGSVLNEVFGELEEEYGVSRLSDFSSFQNGYAFKSKEFNTEGIGLRVIRIGNVLDLDKNPVYIDKRKEFEKYLLKENDIVISMTGTRTKKDYLFVRIVDTNDSYLNQRVGKIVNNEKSNHKFLYYFIQSSSFRDKIFKFETGAVNQGNMSGKDIMNSDIANAPLVVQQKTVKYLDQISEKTEKVKSVQKEKMESLKALKASILDRAFRGKS